MQRKRIAGADRLQPAMRRTALAHVGLGVDLEEAELVRPGENRLDMLGLEANTGPARQAASGLSGAAGAETRRSSGPPLDCPVRLRGAPGACYRRGGGG